MQVIGLFDTATTASSQNGIGQSKVAVGSRIFDVVGNLKGVLTYLANFFPKIALK